MSTYTRILYQVVFGGKDYTSFLTGTNQENLFNYIAGILWNKKCHPYIVGGFKNHIHIVFDLHPSLALSNLVKDIKRASIVMMAREKNNFRRFTGWQVGYGAFTYSQSAKENLVEYVRNQRIHHGRTSYREELIALFREHGVEYDDKYLLK